MSETYQSDTSTAALLRVMEGAATKSAPRPRKASRGKSDKPATSYRSTWKPTSGTRKQAEASTRTIGAASGRIYRADVLRTSGQKVEVTYIGGSDKWGRPRADFVGLWSGRTDASTVPAHGPIGSEWLAHEVMRAVEAERNRRAFTRRKRKNRKRK